MVGHHVVASSAPTLLYGMSPVQSAATHTLTERPRAPIRAARSRLVGFAPGVRIRPGGPDGHRRAQAPAAPPTTVRDESDPLPPVRRSTGPVTERAPALLPTTVAAPPPRAERGGVSPRAVPGSPGRSRPWRGPRARPCRAGWPCRCLSTPRRRRVPGPATDGSHRGTGRAPRPAGRRPRPGPR